MTEPITNATTMPRRVRAGRWMAAAAFAGLAVAFFLPLGPKTSIEIAPLDWLLMREPSEPRWLGPLLCFPWVFAGGMLVLYVLRGRCPGERAQRRLSHAACVVALAAVLMLDGLAAFIGGRYFMQGGMGMRGRDLLLLGSFVLGAFGATAALLMVWAKAPRAARSGACVTIVGLMGLSFFMLLALGGDANLGWSIWLSLIASALMALGGFLEAEALWDAPAEETP